jgi:hypothetical protein
MYNKFKYKHNQLITFIYDNQLVIFILKNKGDKPMDNDDSGGVKQRLNKLNLVNSIITNYLYTLKIKICNKVLP